MTGQEETQAVVLEDSGVIRIPLEIRFEGSPGNNAAVVGESLQSMESLVRKSAPLFQEILGAKQGRKSVVLWVSKKSSLVLFGRSCSSTSHLEARKPPIKNSRR